MFYPREGDRNVCSTLRERMDTVFYSKEGEWIVYSTSRKEDGFCILSYVKRLDHVFNLAKETGSCVLP